MGKVVHFPGTKQPADRELGVRLVQRLREAKARALSTGKAEIIDHDGMEVALIEIVDDFERNTFDVFVRLTAAGRMLLPIPWNV